jgi:mannose-6-phosphate isomerase-like protein (cupin superfamily)
VAPTLKVKELTVEPGKWLSMQRHSQRSEFWFVASGTATVYTLNAKSDFELMAVVEQHGHVWVDNRQWHQLRNEHETPLKVVEIQFGNECEELDIERQQ